MKKYEEEHYQYDTIKGKIYPWIKKELVDIHALGGKAISEKDTPVIAFLGDLKVIFVIKRGEDLYEVFKDSMIPPEVSVEELYHVACENIARDVEYTVANTWYGAFGILADGINEPSAICLKHIWQVCADKLKDDLVIMVPAKDTLLFAPATQANVVEKMIDHGNQAYEQSNEKISTQLLLFSYKRKDLTEYEYTV